MGHASFAAGWTVEGVEAGEGIEGESAMSREEYEEVQAQLISLARMMREIDVSRFLVAVSQAEAAGPLGWLGGHDQLGQVRRLAEGAKAFRRAADQVATGYPRVYHA
jgi:hypothetical protein